MISFACMIRRADSSTSKLPVTIASDHPQAFLSTPDSEIAADGKIVSQRDGVLWIMAEDAGAGVDRLVLKTRTEGGRVVLEVEAVDLVG